MIQAKIYFSDVLPGTSSRLTPGVHSAVDFLGLVKDGEAYDLRFGLEGRGVHKRLFRPAGNFPNPDETVEQALTREIDNNLVHITRMLYLIKGEEFVASFEAEDYDSFVAKAAEELNAHKGFKVNLKVLPGWKEPKYTELGRFKRDTSYVEAWVEGQEPTLQLTEKEMERIVEAENQMDAQ
jgi:hypothetical protein